MQGFFCLPLLLSLERQRQFNIATILRPRALGFYIAKRKRISIENVSKRCINVTHTAHSSDQDGSKYIYNISASLSGEDNVVPGTKNPFSNKTNFVALKHSHSPHLEYVKQTSSHSFPRFPINRKGAKNATGDY